MQLSHISMHCLSKSAYQELTSFFSEHLSSFPISLSAYPKCMLTPMLSKIAKLCIWLQRHCRFLCFRFVINQINWFKISTKPSDKSIPNIYQIFRIYQIKKLYTMHFENIPNFSSLVYIYIPVGNTG